MIYTLVGPSYLFQAKVEELILENHFQEEERFSYDIAETSLFAILENINTISFLSPKKVVFLKEAFFLGGEEKRKLSSEEVEEVLSYFSHPSPDVLLILGVEKLDERKKKLIKVVKEKTKVLSLQENIKDQIKTLFQGYTLEKGVIELLEKAVQGEEARLPLECDKLKLYKIETKEITKEDVQELVLFALPNQEEVLFAFSRCLASRDKKGAYQNYQFLEQMGVDALSLMGLLESQFRTLYQVKVLMDKRMKKDEIASTLGYHPFRVQKTMELVRLFSLRAIKSYLYLIQELDYKMKSGQIDVNLLVDLLIMRV